MQINEDVIRSVVAQVLAEVGRAPVVAGQSFTGRHGVFSCVNEAVTAAREAFEQLSERTLEERRGIIEIIRRIAVDQCVELGTMEMQETKIGRLKHKIEKLKTLGERSPGVEFLRSEVFSGDHGLAIFAAGYPIAEKIACTGGTPQDAIEETVLVGSSSLSYDAASDTYTFVWKTNTAWANTCRQLNVRLNDGTEHKANFKFVR